MELRKHWAGKSLDYCEVALDGCWQTFGLAPAHSRKRRKIETRDQYFEVVAACQFCHKAMDEQMSHEDMEATVKAIIENRST